MGDRLAPSEGVGSAAQASTRAKAVLYMIYVYYVIGMGGGKYETKTID